MTTGRINQVTVLESSPILRCKFEKLSKKQNSIIKHNNRTCPSRIYLGTKALKLLHKYSSQRLGVRINKRIQQCTPLPNTLQKAEVKGAPRSNAKCKLMQITRH